MIEDYMKQLNQVELLSSEEEEELWYKFKEEDDNQARQTLIRSYQPLVFKLVRQHNDFRQLMMDLIQEGTVGLIDAVDRYDPQKGVKFSTFAIYHIKGRIRDYLKEGVGIESISLSHMQLLERLDLNDQLLEGLVERKVLKEKIESIISALPLKEKKVIQKIYLKDQTASTVAAKLDITPSYLYRLRKKAIQRIRGKISREK
jgi:RNA polymerase sporulation-specific sigma factor